MVTGWTGRDACALQSALRMSNQAFAAHLGTGLRTVADWHDKPGMRPRPETQQILDTALAQAPAAVRERFAVLAGGTARAESTGAGEDDGRAPSAARGLHNLPAPRNPVFVDRQEDLAQLNAVMSQEPPASAPVVHGLGGTGKSTLALHFAHRNRDRYNPVWWITADSPASVTTGLAELAARLNPGENPAAKTSAEAAAWAIGWLQDHPGWLLVFDDADSPRSIEPVLGTLTAGRHLITTRRATGWHRVASFLPLAVLPPDASVDMLMQIINSGDPDQTALERLAAELGHLPLALEQAAAYIQETAITPAAYLDRLRRYPARMFAAPAPSDAAGESGRQRTIARIWQLSLQAITSREPLAGEILRILAWLSPDPIPRDLAYELDEDPLTVDDALALLHAYSMITLTAQSVTVHRLVQAVARTPDPADPHRTPGAVSQARDRATRLLLQALPENPLFNVPGWPRWRELLPHVLAHADHIGPGQDTPGTAAILLAASGFLQGDGHFGQAVATARRATDAFRQLQGPDDPDTLTARSFLASAYRAAGDIDAATPLHQQNAADCERVLGADHPETLVARANLAYLHTLQGEPARALELHQRNLADYERVHGPDHPHTLNARANIASCYRDLGDLPHAIALHQQSVTDYARVYGPGHSETITARSNLACDYQLAGNPGQAIPLHQQVLADRERLYGPGHRYTELARQLLANAEHQASVDNPAIDPEPGNREGDSGTGSRDTPRDGNNTPPPERKTPFNHCNQNRLTPDIHHRAPATLSLQRILDRPHGKRPVSHRDPLRRRLRIFRQEAGQGLHDDRPDLFKRPHPRGRVTHADLVTIHSANGIPGDALVGSPS